DAERDGQRDQPRQRDRVGLHGRQDDRADTEDEETGDRRDEGGEATRATAVGVAGKGGGCGHAMTPVAVDECRGSRATATAKMTNRESKKKGQLVQIPRQ